MSYAHEIFGIRETRHDMWMQDLLIAGTSSATFNSDRMREIAASPFVKDNGWAGYYLLLWCKYNNVPLNEVMRVGQKVAIRNSDYGTVDNYILTSMSDGACYFSSQGYITYMPALTSDATYYDGNPSNTLIGTWLRAETPNWHSAIASGSTGLNAVVAEYGYSHGLPDEFKDVLKRNITQPKYVNPISHDEPYYLYNTAYKLGVRNEFAPTGVHIAKIFFNNVLPDKVGIGKPFWSVILPVSATKDMTYPLLGPTWSEKPHVMASLVNVNNMKLKNLDTNTYVDGSVGSYPNMATSNVGHLARFSVEY